MISIARELSKKIFFYSVIVSVLCIIAGLIFKLRFLSSISIVLMVIALISAGAWLFLSIIPFKGLLDVLLSLFVLFLLVLCFFHVKHLSLLLSSIFSDYKIEIQNSENYTISDEGGGIYKVCETNCTKLSYLCCMKCYDIIKHPILYKACKSKGKIISLSPTKLLLCFQPGCIPSVVNGQCQLNCLV